MDGGIDGDFLRARAAEVAALADEVRALAARARWAADAGWESVAAQAYREALDAEIRRVLTAGRAVDEVAAALRAHAAGVEQAGAFAPMRLIGEILGGALP